MVAVIEREAPAGPLRRIERWVYESPLWLLAVCVLAGATALFGYHQSGAMPETVKLVADPFTQNPTVGPWRYSSPMLTLIEWTVGVRSAEAIAFADYLISAALILACAYGVQRWSGPFTARLFLLAYFCSPNAWAGTASLGVVDVWTLGGITVCMTAPAGWCLAAGVVLGFNHFEQAGFALLAVAVIRVAIRGDDRRPVVAGFVGLVVGKFTLLWYLLASGIDTNGRADFIRDRGLSDIIGGWRGHELVIVFAVYNVLWVGVIWMLADMRRRERSIVILLQLLLTVPVMITYDLSRVYRTVTWPIVVLLVLYAAEHADRTMVRRASLWLVLAACFVPRTEIWHDGLRLNG